MRDYVLSSGENSTFAFSVFDYWVRPKGSSIVSLKINVYERQLINEVIVRQVIAKQVTVQN